MKLFLDEYAHLDSPIHRWEGKPKLIAFLSLIFTFAFIEKLFLLPVIIIITVIFFVLSKLPFSFLLSRLRYPGVFILGVVIVLPFLAGETVLFSWGIFRLKLEGILTVVLIVTRFLCILTTTLILFSTAPFLTTLQTLRSLGLSPIINDMMLLTYRYLQEIGESLITMQRALKLKGFNFNQFSKRNLEIIANLIAILLIRSYEQSKLVYQAMILRGYGTNLDQKNSYSNKTNYFHWIACYTIVLISVTLIILQHIIV